MAEMRLAAADDYDALSSFLASFPGEWLTKELWRDRLRFWWELNPAFSVNTERGWLLKTEDKVVGFLGNVPSLLQVGHRIVTVYNATTWRVMPEFRAYTLGMLLKLMRASRTTLLFDTTPSDDVTRILEAFKFRLLPGGDKGSCVAITSLDKVVKHKLRLGLVPTALIRSFTLPASPFLRLGLNKLRPVPGLAVRRLPHADERFDQLWERTRHQYENTNVRTSKVINWYCFGWSNRRKELFACYQDDRLVGYMICSDSKGSSLRPLICADLWVDSEDMDIAKALLFAVKEYSEAKGCGIIEVSRCNSFARMLCSEMRMPPRKSAVPREYMKVPSGLSDSILESNTYFVRAQGDFGL